MVKTANEDDSIDYTALGNIIDYQVNNGIDYMVVLGTTGETPTLSEEEKKEQQKLRAEYVATFRKNLVSTLESTIVERPDGTRLPLVENNKLNKKLK